MEAALLTDLAWGIGMALLGSVVFSGIGLISGTDETATIAPLTLLVILIGVPPAGIGLILGVDRFLDMCRTTLNVIGDLVAATVISARNS